MNKKFIFLILILILILSGFFYYKNSKNLNIETETENDTEIINTIESAPTNLSNKIIETPATTTQTPINVYDYRDKEGIFITLKNDNPTDYNEFKLPINITGYISDNKKWMIFEGEAGLIEIYGQVEGVSKKIASSPIKLLNFDYNMQPPFNFDLMVGDREWISNLTSKDGYILFTENAAKDGEIPDSIKIPIVFDTPINN
jgi:uncharacterized protein (UPF0333 family)